MPTLPTARALAEDLLAFLDASPTAFHATEALRVRLVEAGYVEISEEEPFRLEPGGRYLVVRGGVTVAAFVPGTEAPSRAGFRLLGAHTDSPGLKLKPRPEKVVQGLVCLGVEVYGGPILASWPDRDYGLAGRVILADGDRAVRSVLYRSERPLVSLPNVAIHMNREVNDQGLRLNPQTELLPVLGAVATDGAGVPEKDAIRALLARDLGVPAETLLDFDLFLYDTQKATFAGWNDEFIRSGRLDDLAMCHAAVSALLAVDRVPSAATRLVLCCDAEEVGSQTSAGAKSNLLPNVLERIGIALGDGREGHLQALARSFLVSADNAHAVHPGFEAKSEPAHAPRINGGPVLKVHAGRNYATDALAAATFEQACRRAGVPCQRFVNRSDVKGGSTIGSMTAAQLGVATVDVGAPQYAMHSVREMGGALDPAFMARAMAAFLE